MNISVRWQSKKLTQDKFWCVLRFFASTQPHAWLVNGQSIRCIILLAQFQPYFSPAVGLTVFSSCFSFLQSLKCKSVEDFVWIVQTANSQKMLQNIRSRVKKKTRNRRCVVFVGYVVCPRRSRLEGDRVQHPTEMDFRPLSDASRFGPIRRKTTYNDRSLKKKPVQTCHIRPGQSDISDWRSRVQSDSTQPDRSPFFQSGFFHNLQIWIL